MITKGAIFNKESVNIFTDASITTYNGMTIGCPGYAVYVGDLIVDLGYAIDYDSTNNYSELHAILLGVIAASKYQDFKYIRLFSDSQTSIYALRDRIFKWITKARKGQLYGTSKAPIGNQDIIMEIIYYILDNNIRIEFYHQKGHVPITSIDKLDYALYTFKDSNNINAYIDMEVIKAISSANDHVDRYTKFILDNYIPQVQLYNAVSFGYVPFDTTKYKELIMK